jgi:SulP family sulfate permease
VPKQATPQHRLPVATALLDLLRAGYGMTRVRNDLLAGVTVGVVAVPLSMALAIASGVPPQYGLYTSIVAGIVAAVFGGSRYSISGPTAAFVVILLPITQRFGLGGLLVVTVMAGCILVAMGALRLGRLIQFIPYPVTAGFTAGIGIVIATLQLKDFLGVTPQGHPQHFIGKVVALVHAAPSLHGPDVIIGSITLAVLILWPRLKTRIPGHLVALVIGSLAAFVAHRIWPGFTVETIASRFHYFVDGSAGNGIPPFPPLPVWPWERVGAHGAPIGLSWSLLRDLLPSAFTVAMLGAIESLLCAVVVDGMTGTRHDPNAELVGQGLGNIVAPFFGGITATAAIARTATSIRSGSHGPLAAIFHAVTVLLIVIAFAGLLGYLPMAALAALLIVVAWNMSEARHVVNIVRVAPRPDVAVLLTCIFLTVVFDMVTAVAAGLVLASILFVRRMVDITNVSLVQREGHDHLQQLPESIAVYDINGPLFFGAAEKAASIIQRLNPEVRLVILDMGDVSMMDITGIVALDSLIKRLHRAQVTVVVANLTARIYRKLYRAGLRQSSGTLECCMTLPEAYQRALSLVEGPRTGVNDKPAP